MPNLGKNISALLIAYERPENTIQQMIKLSKLNCRIYLFIDGPKNENVRRKQQYLREQAGKISFSSKCKITINQEEENLKLASAIPKAIDWVFTKEKTAVILEDDIEFREEFLEFSEIVLAKYVDDDEILLVTGNQFMELNDEIGISATSYPLIWGWATSSRKWEIMKALSKKEKLKRKVFLKPQVAAYWGIGWNRARDKKINSWIIAIAAQMRFMGLCCIAPGINLTSNVGDDQVAVHTTKSSPGIRMPLQKRKGSLQINFNSNLNTRVYDQFLEKNIYKIRLRHLITFSIYKLSRKIREK